MNADEPLSDLELSKALTEITQEAIDYLKQPQNREILVAISRNLEQSDPVKFREFKSFLLSHDSDFGTIFENLSHPLSKDEMTIVSALPSAPKQGNLSDGFSAVLGAETTVKVMQQGSNITRQLSL